MSRWAEALVVAVAALSLGLTVAAPKVAAGDAAMGADASGESSRAPAIQVTLAQAVQEALLHAPEVELARLAVAEAEIGLQEAVIGRMAGQPESAYEEARDKVQEARDAYTDALVQVALQVEQAYYNVLRSQELLQIQHGNLDQAERQLAVARARYEAGLIARQDFLEAELNYEQSLDAVDTAGRSLEDAFRRLAELMGLPEDAPLLLTEEVAYSPWHIDLHDALAEALVQRAEIVRAQRAVGQAQRQMAHADTPFAAPVELQRARFALQRAEVELKQAQAQVRAQVREEWYKLVDGQRKVDMERRKEELARTRAEISRARYEAGLIALMDMLRDEAAYAQARLDAAGAVWDYNLAKAQFLRTLGRPELPPLPEPIEEYMATWEELE